MIWVIHCSACIILVSIYPWPPSVLTGIVIISYVCLSVTNDVTALRISSIGLKFGAVMNSNMKQVAIKNGHAWPMFAFSDLGQPRVLSFSEHLVYISAGGVTRQPADHRHSVPVTSYDVRLLANDIRARHRGRRYAGARRGTRKGGGLNPLHAKFFRGNIKHIFTFYVIPPHWYDTGGWNPSSSKKRTHPFHIVNIMAVGVLETQGARTSAAMILT